MAVFFSVIIPTLNEEAFLPQLLSCLAAQEYKHFEVIVVDANSKDSTGQIVLEYKQLITNLKLIVTRKKNVSFQRNLGAKASKGSYLVFFDADVKINSNFLSKISEQLSKKKILLCTTNIIPDDKKLLKRIITTTANIGRDVLLILKQPLAGGYNLIIEKNFFKKIGQFNVEVTYSEDIELLMRAKDNGVLLKNLHEPLQVFSFRRFDQYSYLYMFKIYSKTILQHLRRVKVSKILIDYPMGGHLYKKEN